MTGSRTKVGKASQQVSPGRLDTLLLMPPPTETAPTLHDAHAKKRVGVGYLATKLLQPCKDMDASAKRGRNGDPVLAQTCPRPLVFLPVSQGKNKTPAKPAPTCLADVDSGARVASRLTLRVGRDLHKPTEQLHQVLQGAVLADDLK